MNIRDLNLMIKKYSSLNMRDKGKNILRSSSVFIKGKKFNDFYAIYGKCEKQDTYIKINIKKKIIDKCSCSCSLHKSYEDNGIFMCSHITATFYKFLYSIKANLPSVSKQTDRDIVKEEINKYIKIKRINLNDSVKYECRVFPYKDKKIIKDTELKDYIKNIGDSMIKFTYDYLEVTCKAHYKDMNLYFTIKGRDKLIEVTTQNKLPLSLSKNNDIFFYNNEIYIPSEKQIFYYMKIYHKLIKNKSILIKSSKSNLEKIISLLFNITRNVDIRSEIRDYMYKESSLEFFLYLKDEKVLLDAFVVFSKSKTNILNIDDKKYESLSIKIESKNFIKDKTCFRFSGSDDDLFDILTCSQNTISSMGKVRFSRELKKLIIGSEDIVSSIDNNEGTLNFSYNIGNLTDEDIRRAFYAFKNNKKYYKTSHGFLDLEDSSVISLFNIVDLCADDKNITDFEIDKGKEVFLNSAASNIPNVKGFNSLIEVQEILEENITLPKSFKGNLKDYQMGGVSFLHRNYKLGLGGILADEMGLGKTIQSIALMLLEKDKKFLVVCPSAVIYNWQNEIMKFAPSLKTSLIYGDRREKRLNRFEEYDVFLTTYTTLKMDINLYKNLYFDICIIDEAQNIKNYKSENAKAVKSINSRVNFALTGTPIENNLKELWSIFDFAIKNYLGTIEEFEDKYENNTELLKEVISPFILRRTKSKVNINIKDKRESIVSVSMTRNQRAVYNSYLKSIKNAVKKNKNISVLPYLTKLREICIEPSLVKEDYSGGSGKINEALKIINSNSCKILLFSQFTSALDIVEENLRDNNISCFRIDGKTSAKSRIDRVNEFNNFKGKAVFLISLKAGGVGLNLTSASLVIHFDPWWNPASEDQATDRAHRIGQKKHVKVIKLICRKSIEEKIISLQNEKKDLIDNVLSGDIHNADKMKILSNEELLKLLF